MTDQQFIDWLQTDSAVRTVLVEVVARVSGAEATQYLSNRPYATLPTDAPASVEYVPCIVGGVSFSETLSLSGEPSISYGDIEIDNMDGSRDVWLGYVWANRAVKVYMGDPRWPRADFRLIFDGVVGDIDARSQDVLNLTLLDKLQRLNTPLSEVTLGGTTDSKDRLIPLTFGECHNVTPLLVDPATLTYQVHGGAIEDVIEVRDNGIPVAVTESLAAGKFTLAKAPSGTVTASVQGDKPAGVYANDVASLVQRIATAYGAANTRLASSDLDLTSLAAFTAANPAPVGLYSAERDNALAACQQLAASAGAQVVCTTLGKLRLVKLSLPASGTPKLVTSADIDFRSLAPTQRPPVSATVKLAYCRNWTVQASGMAGGVPAAHLDLFAQEWLTEARTDAAVAAAYKLDAQPTQEETLLLTAAGAGAEAQRRLALWSTPRTVFSVRAFPHMLLTELGDPITLQHARFGLAAGKTGVVVKIDRDWLGGRVTLGVLV